MEKTEMMKEYERETRETLDMSVLSGDATGSWYGFLDMMDEKATAYDRLMSGGRKTLKDWANFFGMVVAVDANGNVESFAREPRIDLHYGFWYCDENAEDFEDENFIIPKDIVDYTGDWRDSLTLPDGWEES